MSLKVLTGVDVSEWTEKLIAACWLSEQAISHSAIEESVFLQAKKLHEALSQLPKEWVDEVAIETLL